MIKTRVAAKVISQQDSQEIIQETIVVGTVHSGPAFTLNVLFLQNAKMRTKVASVQKDLVPDFSLVVDNSTNIALVTTIILATTSRVATSLASRVVTNSANKVATNSANRAVTSLANKAAINSASRAVINSANKVAINSASKAVTNNASKAVTNSVVATSRAAINVSKVAISKAATNSVVVTSNAAVTNKVAIANTSKAAIVSINRDTTPMLHLA